ncbi:hypothetical protein AAVH_15802 [Aphelenchoides avenae]|nr:hypothetical protein AAVH_15802 [Aphelenchus avenae]
MRCLFILFALTATAIARKPPFWDGLFAGERYVVVYGNIVCPPRPVCTLCGIGPEVFNSVSLQYRSQYQKEYRALGNWTKSADDFLVVGKYGLSKYAPFGDLRLEVRAFCGNKLVNVSQASYTGELDDASKLLEVYNLGDVAVDAPEGPK